MPPLAVTTTDVAPIEQGTVVWLSLTTRGVGSVIARVVVAAHNLVSRTETVYVPATSPVRSWLLLCPTGINPVPLADQL